MYPSISIVTTSLNTDLTMVKTCLERVREQDYPKDKIEHIVMDGGSTNGSDSLAKKYGCTVVHRSDLREQGQVRTGLGIKKAKGDILLILELDNFLTSKTWLRDMVRPFMEHPDVVGAFSAFNSYESTMPILTQYCMLFGHNDPAVFYLGKSEKLPHYKRVYDKGTILSHGKAYDVVRFDKRSLPTLGDNGHMLRRLPYQAMFDDPSEYLHTDMIVRLLEHGYNTYGVVYNSIVHITGDNLWKFASRRAVLKNQYQGTAYRKRQYLLFNPRDGRDVIRLGWFCVCSVTFIEPFLTSVRGFLYEPTLVWFYHPIVCFVCCFAYVFNQLFPFFRHTLRYTK